MSVKRYEVNGSSSVFENENGSLVDYEDYAALEARFAALAAENAGLKAAELDEIEVINRGGQAYCVKDGMSVNPIYARGWNDYRAKSLSVKTPATDAFLAEVRAQGVEMFAAVLRRKGDDAFFDAIAEAQANAADQFAAQLRKGVQS